MKKTIIIKFLLVGGIVSCLSIIFHFATKNEFKNLNRIENSYKYAETAVDFAVPDNPIVSIEAPKSRWKSSDAIEAQLPLIRPENTTSNLLLRREINYSNGFDVMDYIDSDKRQNTVPAQSLAMTNMNRLQAIVTRPAMLSDRAAFAPTVSESANTPQRFNLPEDPKDPMWPTQPLSDGLIPLFLCALAFGLKLFLKR